MAWPTWTVEHYDHEFVPTVGGDPEISDGGDLLCTVAPDQLQFRLQLGKLGPGTIAYDLGLHARDTVTNLEVVEHEFVGAYRTDFLLKRSGLTDPLMGGMHTPAPAATDGAQPQDKISIAGQDWLHYLQRRVWPYDATLSYVNWPAGLRFAVAAGEIGDIVRALLETVRDVSPNWPLPPDPPGGGGHPSYSLGFTVDCDDTSTTTNFEISPMDTTTIYDMIVTLAQNPTGEGGFDFLMTFDKIFRLVYPEIGTPASPLYTLEQDAVTHLANMRELGMTNTGPAGTHFLGVGAGSSGQAGGVNRHFRANSAVYRRLDAVEQFGDVKNLDLLETLTGGALSTGANPILEIPCVVNPNDIEGFWAVTRPGQYVTVNWDFGAHQLASVQKIVTMDCAADQEGNESVTLGFNNYNPADTSSGLDDF